MFKKINLILNNYQKKRLLLLIFFWLILYFLEIIGIGSVPIIISSLLGNQDFFYMDLLKIIDNYFKTFFDIKNQVLLISILILVFYTIKTIFYILLTIFEAKVFKDLNVFIKEQAFKAQIKQPYLNYTNNSTSQIVKIIIQDSSLATSYIISFVTIISQSFLFLLIIILLSIVNFKVTFLVIPIFGLIYLAFYLITNKKLFNLGKEKQILHGQILKQINNTFENLKEVIIYNKFNYLSNYFKKDVANGQSKIAYISILKKIPKAIYEFLGVIFIFSIIFYGYINSYSNENTVILLSLITVAIIRIMPSINLITQNVSNIKSSEYSFNIIKNLIIFNQKEKNLPKKENKPIFFEKKISFQNVSFEYPNSKNRLININFSINKNSVVGIFGPSGSGKSTLINLICGLLKPDEGEITVDEKNIHSNISMWQKKISYVTQDNFLLDDTILNNLIFSDENSNFDKMRFNYSIKKTNLENFVEKFKDMYQTEVGDKGVKLSGGQKQRLSIARAIYKMPEIIIFDESTSALDSETEKDIIDEIYKIKGVTIILISHKKNLLTKCDKILNLLDGKIINN